MALVRSDILEERIASIIRVTRIGELGIRLVVTSNRSMLRSMFQLLVTAVKTSNLTQLELARFKWVTEIQVLG
jgi:hypothetical protein